MAHWRYRQSLLAGLALAFGLAPYAAAQQTVAPRQLFRGTVERESPWLALLREANALGSQEQMVSVITEFLADLSQASELSTASSAGTVPCCDQRQYVFQVAFLASEAADAPLIRIFVHKDGLTRGALPGIRGREQPLFELFVAEDLSVRLDSIYQSTPREDPLAEASGDFVKLILGKLALPIGANTIVSRVTGVMNAPTRSPQQAAMRRTKPPLAVTLSRVDLPAKRATITVSHTVTVADPAAHIRAQTEWSADTALRKAVVAAALADPSRDSQELAVEVMAAQPAYAPCSAMAGQIADATAKALDGSACSPLKAEPAGCFKEVETAIGAAYEAAAGQAGGCPAAEAFPLVRRFLSSVPAKLPPPAKGTIVLTNAPESRWSFGLSTAYIAAIDTDNTKPRTKISSGRIVVDPFSRVLAMGIVSFIPAGYDPESVQLTARERFRLFGGIAFAPHFGATGGAAWSLNRYLGVNAGYALLVYDTPKPGESIDIEPSPENRAAPFDLAGTHAFFVGLTYNIK